MTLDMLVEHEHILGCTSEERRFKQLHAEIHRLELDAPPIDSARIISHDLHVQYVEQQVSMYDAQPMRLPAADIKVNHLKTQMNTYRSKLHHLMKESFRGFRSSDSEPVKYHYAKLFEAYATVGERYELSLWFHHSKLNQARQYQEWYRLTH